MEFLRASSIYYVRWAGVENKDPFASKARGGHIYILGGVFKPRGQNFGKF